MGQEKKSPEDVTAGLMAVIGSATFREAEQTLKAEGRDIHESTLRRWCKEDHAVRFEKMREEWGPKIEAQLASNLLDNARLAAATERLAIERAKTSLEDGSAREPAKMARDISQVKAQAIDKRLALQGRPTQITEKRDVNEIVRALVGMRVLQVASLEQVPDATAASLQPSVGTVSVPAGAAQVPQEATNIPGGPIESPPASVAAGGPPRLEVVGS